MRSRAPAVGHFALGRCDGKLKWEHAEWEHADKQKDVSRPISGGLELKLMAGTAASKLLEHRQQAAWECRTNFQHVPHQRTTRSTGDLGKESACLSCANAVTHPAALAISQTHPAKEGCVSLA